MTDASIVQTGVSLGSRVNAGGPEHAELQTVAKERLEERGLQVNLFNQDGGESKADGEVHLPNVEVAHLEAAHSTPSKPAKVLQNFRRAIKNDAVCIFVVEQGNAAKFRNIVEDPVNRHGDKYEDEYGSYSYYTDDGDEFTDTELILDASTELLRSARTISRSTTKQNPSVLRSNTNHKRI